jgi:fructokinase
MTGRLRIGIDLGGTKTAIAVLDQSGGEVFAHRNPTPRGDYAATLRAIAALIAEAERALGCPGEASIGVGMPGSMSPITGRVQNANSTWLNDMPLDADLQALLARPVRFANDANCFALSEAVDGAGAGVATLFGVILGTGCGGGLVVNGGIVNGPLGVTGEWGHNPLPWPGADEAPGPQCWCGLRGCMETWVAGPSLHRDYLEHGGDPTRAPAAESLPDLAQKGDEVASAALQRHASRLARGLASVVNFFDPHVIVLGGGLSRLEHLYTQLPRLMAPYIFAAKPQVTVKAPRHGDASGVRGAARLWDR